MSDDTEWFGALPEKTDEELYELCKEYIWLSAYASNNPKSGYHARCDAIYEECDRRGNTELYQRAWEAVAK